MAKDVIILYKPEVTCIGGICVNRVFSQHSLVAWNIHARSFA